MATVPGKGGGGGSHRHRRTTKNCRAWCSFNGDLHLWTNLPLKGFFNALEAFRLDRDLEGWRLEDSIEQAGQLETYDASHAIAQGDYPAFARITSELLLYAGALRMLFDQEESLTLPVRPSRSKALRYVIGDASAEGFAIATQYPEGRVDFKDGLYLSGRDETFAEGGSNLREAQNQVNHLVWEIGQGKHDGCEIWAATDHDVFAQVWVWQKGISTA